MLTNSEGGYVLFDAKPVCIHGFKAEDDFIRETRRHLSSVILREGALLLKDKKFKEENILIHVYDNRDVLAHSDIHLLFINKRMFLDVVKSNLPLFQYVLGPEITPEKLLSQLTNPKESFHGVLREDKTLIGILLGFGTQNSLYVSRFEELEKVIFSECPPLSRRFSKFDLVSSYYTKFSMAPTAHKEMLFLNCSQDNNLYREPSLGYFSIEEELDSLIRKISLSSEKLENNLPYFIFGHLKDKDSELLIGKLEKAQEKINQLLHSEMFLQETLKLAFPEESFNISTSTAKTLFAFNQDEIRYLPYLVAKNIWNNIEIVEKAYVEAFIAGMKLSEESKAPPTTSAGYSEYWRQKKLMNIKNNLKLSDDFFVHLSANHTMKSLSPLRLYYTTLKMGEGDEVKNIAEVLVHYLITFPDGEILADTFKKYPEKLKLSETIPGFALGMKGMKVGEEREIFIHPSLGYGIFTGLQKGMYLKVRLKLVDIVSNNSEEDTAFSNLEILDLNKELNSHEMLSENDCIELSKAVGLTSGYETWNHYKKCDSYTSSQILDWFHRFEAEQEGLDISSLKDQNLINKLHWNLYQQ